MANYSLVFPGFRSRRNGERLKVAYALYECGHEYLEVMPLAYPTANNCPLHGMPCDLSLYLVSYSEQGDERVRKMFAPFAKTAADEPETTSKLLALVDSLRSSAQDTLKALNHRGWDVSKVTLV